MKKVLALILTALMIMTLAACSGNDAQQQSSVAENSSTVESSEPIEQSQETPESSEAPEASDAPSADGSSVAQTLLADFQEKAAANPDMTADEMALAIIENEILAFGPATMPVEPGLLSGFGNAEITGFTQGTMFAPMISTIPFIGYIFVVDEATDVEQFKADLQANADLRWNICVEAEEMVVDNVGNMVFFVMSPINLEA